MKEKIFDSRAVGERIKQARKAKHYTQEQASEMIDMSTKNFSQLERGMTGMSISTLVGLCRALDVSADYILFGMESREQKNTVSLLLSELNPKEQLQAEKLLGVFAEFCNDK